MCSLKTAIWEQLQSLCSSGVNQINSKESLTIVKMKSLLLVLPVALARVATFKTHTIIPMFTRELASSSGHELEVVNEAKTVYDGACYVSEHGQRSAACVKFDHGDPLELYNDAFADKHPLRS